MQVIKKIVASSTNTTSRNASQRYVLSPNRCTNVFLVGQEKYKDVCSKRMLIDIETNEEFCPQCRSVEKEDQKLAIETLAIKKKNEIIHLYDSFADTSLINDKLKKATFENYVPPKKELNDAKEMIMNFVASFNKEEPTSVIITGDYGVGKSHLCVAAIKELMKKGHSAMFIQMNKLFTKIKSTWNKNSEMTEDKLMSLLAKVDVLIIDDFGAEFTEKDKEGVTWKQTKTNEIVDSRIGKSTLFTTNFNIGELAGMYGERDFSRMMENAEMLEMHGDNYRLRNFKKGE
ncbi:ATP-binding protein [Bacillus sp. TH22]|uniref:ATP-binding protein n=1 Tax=unclassified Bacillus (in: firmicutes) TaxID=185979 RepID=UPI0019118EDD|nr:MULTISPECIES: ATP-binding protein [unclassified Bacillus (in: firmicutes)]MBK5447461.1 ATP-binding protein [Bacillus sp. TH22]MBK5453679.1 ATP-binding protein [Bacillus sp. TH23]